MLLKYSYNEIDKHEVNWDNNEFMLSAMFCFAFSLAFLINNVITVITRFRIKENIEEFFSLHLLILIPVVLTNFIFLYVEDEWLLVNLFWVFAHIQMVMITSLAIVGFYRLSNFTNYSKRFLIFCYLPIPCYTVIHFYAERTITINEKSEFLDILNIFLLFLTLSSLGFLNIKTLKRILKIISNNKESIEEKWALSVGLMLFCSFLCGFLELMFSDSGLNELFSEYAVGFNYILCLSAVFCSLVFNRATVISSIIAETALETKRVFVRYVSHEIRTPLNTALLGMKLLSNEMKQIPNPLRSTLSDLLSDTNLSCTIAVETLNDLLMYEKIDGNLLSLEIAEVRLWPFIDEVLQVFQIQARIADIDLSWPNYCVDGVFVQIDRYKIAQVMRNLVSNALKFTSAGGKVRVQAKILVNWGSKIERSGRYHSDSDIADTEGFSTNPRLQTSVGCFDCLLPTPWVFTRNNSGKTHGNQISPQSENSNKESKESSNRENGSKSFSKSLYKKAFKRMKMVRISVTDTGAGLTKENQQKLFKNIVQFHASKLQQGGGSGIGLWISSKIIGLHGGRIGVVSEGEGLGSTFYIDIPIMKIKSVRGDNEKGSLRIGTNGAVGTNIKNSRRHIGVYPTISPKNENENIGFEIENSEIPEIENRSFKKLKTVDETINEETNNAENSYSENKIKLKPGSRTILPPLNPKLENITFFQTTETNDLKPNYAEQEEKDLLQSKSALIVDDSAMNRKLLNRLLKDTIGTRDEARDGSEAVTKCQEKMSNGCPYDIILMDFVMPIMNGPTATKTIREMGFNGIIIGVTGNGHQSDLDIFLDSGVDEIFLKPLTAETFNSSVRDLLLKHNEDDIESGFETKNE